MNTQQDFEEFLKLLEKNKVQYLIVGGYAVAFHGYPRFTQDIDIFYNNVKDNIKKIIDSLVEFGFSEKDLKEDIFIKKGNIIQFGIPPVRIDLINQIDGVSFEEAEKNKVRGKYGEIKVNFIGKKELIKNKNCTGRLKDKADIEELK